MRITLFNRVDDVKPMGVETLQSREDWLRVFRRCKNVGSKIETPCFGPFILRPDGQRRNKDVVWMTGICLDLDDQSALDYQRIIDFTIKGLEVLQYTTWSHTKNNDLVRVRVVIPFAIEQPVKKWPVIWKAAADYFCGGVAGKEGLADSSSKKPSQPFFFPSNPVGEEQVHRIEYVEGARLDVERLLAIQNYLRLPTQKALRNDADSIKHKQTADALTKLADGQAYAEPGTRDDLTWRLACVLNERYEKAPPEMLCKVFERSVAVMAVLSPDAPSMSDVYDKITRSKAAVTDQREQEQTAQSVALAVIGRTETYSDEELQALAKYCNESSSAGLGRRWIVQRRKAFWFLGFSKLGDPTYVGEYTSADVKAAGSTMLAPALSAGVDPWKHTRSGKSLRAADELVGLYGRVLDDVVYDMGLQSTEIKGNILYVATCPLRRIEARYDERIEEWLTLMGGDRCGALFDWLAMTPDLSKPLTGLYLQGNPGAGKGLLARGVARLWTTHRPTTISTAIGIKDGWNEKLARCPLVFCDEMLPRDRGRPVSAELKELIQRRDHDWKRKYISDSELRGCVRVIMAANNQGLMRSFAESDMTRDDVQAIAERLLYIPVTGDRAAQYLAMQDEEWVDSIVEGDRLAGFVLWLQQNRMPERRGRFGITHGAEELAQLLTVGSGLRSAVLDWVTNFLENPGQAAPESVVIEQTQAGPIPLLSPRHLQTYWDQYCTHYRSPQASHLSRALDGLTTETRITGQPGQRIVYRAIDVELYRVWAGLTGRDWSDLQARMAARYPQARTA